MSLRVIFVVVFMCIFYASQNVYAEGDISFSFEGVSEDHEITAARGGTYNSVMIIENLQEEPIDVRVHFEDEDGKTKVSGSQKSLVAKTVFYTSTLKDDFQQMLRDNNDDIATFCKKNIEDQAINTWCNGQNDDVIHLETKEKKNIPITITIDDQETDHNFFVVATRGAGVDEVVMREKYTYRVPDRNVAQVDLVQFVIEKQIDTSNVFTKIRSGIKNEYVVNIQGVNTGTEDVEVEYYVQVQPSWFGEQKRISEIYRSVPNETRNIALRVIAPQLGAVNVIGGVHYANHAGEIKNITSEPVQMMIWPTGWLVVGVLGICFCTICVLLYKYINKNMFTFRKNKSEKTTYVDTYIVQDTDNIISIAQKFNVPWKELSSINKIDAPYILISGESIAVPHVEDQEGEKISRDTIAFTHEQNDMRQANEMMDHVQEDKQDVVVPQELLNDPIKRSSQMISENERSIGQRSFGVQDGIDNVSSNDGGKAYVNADKKKNSITFASPQSMLTQPASEPTTRAIDIEWMRDDEEAYMEEMQLQQKKVNVHLIGIIVAICAAVGVGTWFGVSHLMKMSQKETIPVEALIQEPNNALVNNEPKSAESVIEQVDVTNENASMQEQKEEGSQSNGSPTVQPQDIAIQVLNAGGETGAAGSLTKVFKDKGYKTLSAQNAQNDHVGVVIYYNDAQKDHVATILPLIPEKYGTQKQESSEDITKKYAADIVIVLGTQK